MSVKNTLRHLPFIIKRDFHKAPEKHSHLATFEESDNLQNSGYSSFSKLAQNYPVKKFREICYCKAMVISLGVQPRRTAIIWLQGSLPFEHQSNQAD